MFIRMTFVNSYWFTIYVQGFDSVELELKLLVSGSPLVLSGVANLYVIVCKL